VQIIRNRTITDDDFVHVPDGAELPAAGKPIVTLARYAAGREDLLARYPALGVRITCDKLPTDIPEFYSTGRKKLGSPIGRCVFFQAG